VIQLKLLNVTLRRKYTLLVANRVSDRQFSEEPKQVESASNMPFMQSWLQSESGSVSICRLEFTRSSQEANRRLPCYLVSKGARPID
jgi:hypothetical protein